MSKVFVGIIIVAVIGNAAEHSTAVTAAKKNRMDLSVGIATGSSTQIALFVTPLLVFLSYFIAPRLMDLVFTPGQVFAIVISASLLAHTTSDGKSNWFTGLLLLTVYLALAVAFSTCQVEVCVWLCPKKFPSISILSGHHQMVQPLQVWIAFSWLNPTKF